MHFIYKIKNEDAFLSRKIGQPKIFRTRPWLLKKQNATNLFKNTPCEPCGAVFFYFIGLCDFELVLENRKTAF